MSQETMYPTIAFSPQTQLTTAINETATRLHVSNPAAFGPLPTLITLIKADGIGETVLALAEGSDFVDVTRNIEGENQAWPINTVIMRSLASADIAAIQGNIRDLDTTKANTGDIPTTPAEVGADPAGAAAADRKSVV